MKIPVPSERQWKLIGMGVLVLIVFGSTLFIVDRCSVRRSNNAINKAKQQISNTVAQITEAKANVAVDELKKAELQGQLLRDKENLDKLIFGQEDRLKAVNAALNKVANVSTNSNVTADDIRRLLDQIDEGQ